MIKIVQREEPVLRGKASALSPADVTIAKTKGVVKRMKQALAEQEDGIAIAAPQIGAPYRIFVVSKRLFAMKDGVDPEKYPERLEKYSDKVFINPELFKLSRKRLLMPEGCLSVRWLYGRVSRAEKAKIRAYNENGRKFEMGGSGLLAQVFQHETDHLNGILFTDTAVDVRDMPPEKRNKIEK
ncbi:peptide deformylase [bacterium]|nr:peptide deformylase [bacterium]